MPRDVFSTNVPSYTKIDLVCIDGRIADEEIDREIYTNEPDSFDALLASNDTIDSEKMIVLRLRVSPALLIQVERFLLLIR